MTTTPSTHSTSPAKKRKLTTDTSLAVADDGAEHLDLGYLLAPLPRRTVELLLCRLINQHPEYSNTLLTLSRRKVDTHELHNDILNILAYGYDQQHEITSQLEPFVERSEQYVKAADIHNAITILSELCTESVRWYCKERQRKEGEDEEDVKNAESWWGLVESSWENALKQVQVVTEDEMKAVNDKTSMSEQKSNDETKSDDAVTNSSTDITTAQIQQSARTYQLPDTARRMTAKQLEVTMKSLQQWQQQLTPWAGPIFSDTVRMIKKMLAAPAQ